MIKLNDIPVCFMLVGLPGSGKSTFVEKCCEGFVVLSTDAYIEQKALDLGTTYSEIFKSEIKPATANMYRMLEQAIDLNSSIVWDQTNITVKSRRDKLAKIPAHYGKTALVFDPGIDVIKKRLYNRGNNTGKWIPEHILSRMIQDFEYPTLEEGFDTVLKYSETV